MEKGCHSREILDLDPRLERSHDHELFSTQLPFQKGVRLKVMYMRNVGVVKDIVIAICFMQPFVLQAVAVMIFGPHPDCEVPQYCASFGAASCSGDKPTLSHAYALQNRLPRTLELLYVCSLPCCLKATATLPL